MNPLNIDNRIKFQTIELKAGEEYQTAWKEIITVVSWKINQILTNNELKTFESSFFHKWNKFKAIEDSLLTIVSISDDINHNNIDVETDFWEYCRNNWTSVYDAYWVLEWTDLYKSDVIEYEFNWIRYKSNYWFCWKNVDCWIHNEHNFIEIHTSILWDWRMEKFLNNDENTIVEEVNMRPWLSHRPFNKIWEIDKDWNPIYPYHRWKWNEKWDIWLVIEKY